MLKKFNLGFIALVCFACAPNRIELLNDRLEQYNQAMEWSTVAQLRGCIETTKRGDILKDLLPRMEKEKVVEYSISDLTLDDKKKKAIARVVYTYYTNSDQDVKDRIEHLGWEFSSTKQAWYLTSRSVTEKPK